MICRDLVIIDATRERLHSFMQLTEEKLCKIRHWKFVHNKEHFVVLINLYLYDPTYHKFHAFLCQLFNKATDWFYIVLFVLDIWWKWCRKTDFYGSTTKRNGNINTTAYYIVSLIFNVQWVRTIMITGLKQKIQIVFHIMTASNE